MIGLTDLITDGTGEMIGLTDLITDVTDGMIGLPISLLTSPMR
jgi:hypothetical protein